MSPLASQIFFFFLLRRADEGKKENRPCCKGNKNSSRHEFDLKKVSCMVDKKVAS